MNDCMAAETAVKNYIREILMQTAITLGVTKGNNNAAIINVSDWCKALLFGSESEFTQSVIKLAFAYYHVLSTKNKYIMKHFHKYCESNMHVTMKDTANHMGLYTNQRSKQQTQMSLKQMIQKEINNARNRLNDSMKKRYQITITNKIAGGGKGKKLDKAKTTSELSRRQFEYRRHRKAADGALFYYRNWKVDEGTEGHSNVSTAIVKMVLFLN